MKQITLPNNFSESLSDKLGIKLPEGVVLQPSHHVNFYPDRTNHGFNFEKVTDENGRDTVKAIYLAAQTSPHFNILPTGAINIKYEQLAGLVEFYPNCNEALHSMEDMGTIKGGPDRAHIFISQDAEDPGKLRSQPIFKTGMPISGPVAVYYPGRVLVDLMIELNLEDQFDLNSKVQEMLNALGSWMNDPDCAVIVETWGKDEETSLPVRLDVEIHDSHENRMEALDGWRDISNSFKDPESTDLLFFRSLY